jgi:hypothetical protein
MLGGRYIPAVNYSIKLPKQKMIDFEASANIFGTFGFHPFDTSAADGQIKPYRAWARYSSRQFEFRLGLQKINFGSAAILRPLMWFDQIDPRDPLQLTDGVWAALGRYYFLNNANLWIWCLYGNKNPKGWDFAKTNSKYPEFGGRVQVPVPRGEVALSYHYRIADTRGLQNINAYSEAPENRVGLDGKLNLGFGLWFEGSWIGNTMDLGKYTNQEIFNIGADNTFRIGNGLNVVIEQLFASYDETAFSFSNKVMFTGSSISYPVGIFDNLSGIIYYDWTNSSLYNFVNWKRQFDKITFYLMAYWNPEVYLIPLRSGDTNFYAGKGIQVMFVYNH